VAAQDRTGSTIEILALALAASGDENAAVDQRSPGDHQPEVPA
jgi:hypothetical protein